MEVVKMYRTSDGETFKFQAEAERHEDWVQQEERAKKNRDAIVVEAHKLFSPEIDPEFMYDDPQGRANPEITLNLETDYQIRADDDRKADLFLVAEEFSGTNDVATLIEVASKIATAYGGALLDLAQYISYIRQSGQVPK